MNVSQLLNARLLLVTGKGGTGKSTVSAALGQLAAERGRTTVVVEVDAFQPAQTALLGRAPTYEPRPVRGALSVCNITWHEALREWLAQTVPAQRVVRLILNNRMVQLFLDATPGARDTVILSKIVELVDRYDLVVVDMPASGHAVSMLRVPRLALNMMRAGPIHDRSRQILEVLGRPGVGAVIVGLPEEMVINETLELQGRLRAEVPELDASTVVLNRVAVPSLEPAERTLMERLAVAASTPEERELVAAGLWEAQLERATAKALARLEHGAVSLDVVKLPRLGALGGFARGPAQVARQMAAAFARLDVAGRTAG